VSDCHYANSYLKWSKLNSCLCSTNTAPCVGPIIGGILSQYVGWPWVFWFLAILGGAFLFGTILLYPETAREVVGNGSIPARGLNKTVYAIFRDPICNTSKEVQDSRAQSKFRIPNPFNCLIVLGDANSLLIMAVGSIYYGTFSVLATSVSTILFKEYSLSYLTSGLMYLPAGAGGVIAALCTGKALRRDRRTSYLHSKGRLLDRDYKVVDQSLGESIQNETRAQKLMRIPIEKARLRSSFYFMAVNIIAIIGYGWSLEARTVG
jgi:MFS family permease